MPPEDVTPPAPAGPKPPPRSPDEIERDIEAERQGLVDAVSELRSEIDATRDRIQRAIPRVAAVVGALIVFRLFRRRRRRRRGG